MGWLFVGSVGIVPQWFLKKRSMANGLATAGAGLGGMTYSLATNAMIQRISLAWAFRILGILSFTVNIIATFLIRDRNKAIGAKQLSFDYMLFRRPEFLLLQGWAFFSMLGYIVLLYSMPNYAVTVGLSQYRGSIVGALVSLGQGIGRPTVGVFSDKVGRINMAGFATFLTGLFCFVIWIFAKKFGVLIFFAIIIGTVAGTFWTTVGPVTAEVVGLKELPSALNMTWLALVIPLTFSEAIALELVQTNHGNYLHAQIFSGVMYIAGAVCLWFLRAWKIGEVEALAAQEKKNAESIDAAHAHLSENGMQPSISRIPKFNLLKRMCMLRRV